MVYRLVLSLQCVKRYMYGTNTVIVCFPHELKLEKIMHFFENGHYLQKILHILNIV